MRIFQVQSVVKWRNMNFGARLRIFGILTGILLMANVQGGDLKGDVLEICDYCKVDDLMPCNDSAQIESRVQCDSTKGTCILGLAKPFNDSENLTMTTLDSDLVCLVQSGITLDQTTPSVTSSSLGAHEPDTIPMDPLDESMSTGASIMFRSQDMDYQSDQDTESAKTSETFPETKSIECFSCDSRSDKACLEDADKLKAIKCDMPSECLTVFIDGHIVRNCSSAFSDSVLELCHKPDTTSCRRCQTAKCNKLPWTSCYRCGPSDGPNCTLSSSSIPIEICPNYNDECSVRITASGDTVRECSRPDAACQAGEICSRCPQPLCNHGVFPPKRARCIQCLECEEKQDPKTALPCTHYSAEEKCFSYLTPKSKMIRGCVSDAEGKLQCEANAPTCITCNDRDGCNDMPLMKEPSLSCHKCNSKADAGCAWAQLPKTLTKCQNKVLYYLKETCMMDFDTQSQTAVRGCSFDQGSCTPEDKNCRTCSGDGCNSGNLKVQECIQCSSKAPGQENCSKLAQGIPSTKCPQETQPYQGRGCFTMTRGNVTTRGCIVGLTPEDVKFCTLEEQSQCNLCTEDGCNNRRAPSGAEKSAALSIFLMIWAACVVF